MKFKIFVNWIWSIVKVKIILHTVSISGRKMMYNCNLANSEFQNHRQVTSELCFIQLLAINTYMKTFSRIFECLKSDNLLILKGWTNWKNATHLIKHVDSYIKFSIQSLLIKTLLIVGAAKIWLKEHWKFNYWFKILIS